MLLNFLTTFFSYAINFSAEGSTIEVNSSVFKNSIVLTVKDNGMGISAVAQEHWLARFFRGANVTNIQGTGPGLHIVAKYIELMDGKIEFESELEKGTKFIITLNLNTA